MTTREAIRGMRDWNLWRVAEVMALRREHEAVAPIAEALFGWLRLEDA